LRKRKGRFKVGSAVTGVRAASGIKQGGGGEEMKNIYEVSEGERIDRAFWLNRTNKMNERDLFRRG